MLLIADIVQRETHTGLLQGRDRQAESNWKFDLPTSSCLTLALVTRDIFDSVPSRQKYIFVSQTQPMNMRDRCNLPHKLAIVGRFSKELLSFRHDDPSCIILFQFWFLTERKKKLDTKGNGVLFSSKPEKIEVEISRFLLPPHLPKSEIWILDSGIP